MEHLAFLALKSLGAVNDQLVVIGGTAHRLFLHHELAATPKHELLTTEDVDIAAPSELATRPGLNLLAELKKVGFEDDVAGAGGNAPAHKYRLQDHPMEYVQFIAPKVGSGERRDGKDDRVLKFGGLYAEKLRNVEVMLHEPWRLQITFQGEELRVQVVNPITYMLQKLLSLNDRRREKQGKDVLYLFDTLTIFSGSLDELKREASHLAPELTQKQTRSIRRAAQEHCFVLSDATREAAFIAKSQRQNAPTPGQVAAGCRFLSHVLGQAIPEL